MVSIWDDFQVSPLGKWEGGGLIFQVKEEKRVWLRFEPTQVENDNEIPTGCFIYGQELRTVLPSRDEDLKGFRLENG